jgi:tetratricopeptide (TPR) repeat protein
VLLRAGSLTGWLGSARQIQGTQELAKDLISEAGDAFETIGDRYSVMESRNALAICYWREGAFDEARVVLQPPELSQVKPSRHAELNSILILAMLSWAEGHAQQAVDIYLAAASLFDLCDDHSLKARFHNGFALALRKLDQLDRALIEYTAAGYYFEKAGHERYQARVENNLGFLFLTLNRHDEAHEKLERARNLFVKLNDRGSAAQVDETRARLLLEQKEFKRAEKIARLSVETFEGGDEHALLVEALQTHAVALARLGMTDDSLSQFLKGYQMSSAMISREQASKVFVAMVEELAGQAFIESNISFEEAVRRFEESLLRSSLDSSGGKITEAALRLGVKYQSLAWMLQTRHRNLESSRKPPRVRRKSIITIADATDVRTNRNDED